MGFITVDKESWEKIVVVKEYIDENFCKDLNVTEIAEKFGLNPKVLTERFAYCFGVTVKKYILDKKRYKFMEMIRERNPKTPLNISGYGYELGFNSSASFRNFIKRSTGKTCTELMDEI